MRKLMPLLLIVVFFFSCERDQDPSRCRLTKITSEFLAGGISYSVVYSGNRITELNNEYVRQVFTYDAAGNLIQNDRLDRQTGTLRQRTVFTYGAPGKASRMQFYSHQHEPAGELIYQEDYGYEQGRLTSIRYEYFTGNGGDRTGKWLIGWTGDNPATMGSYTVDGHRSGCANDLRFSVDAGRKNNLEAVIPHFRYIARTSLSAADLWLISGNPLTRVDGGCTFPGTATHEYSYEYDSNGLVREIRDKGNPLYRFEYTCD
ncbi:MAG TPA: hypothetical protein VHK69_00940 [Chitinophagaceae bacterium]|jgi:YD repeat-containing protein|nr:hypothetical protein [Chitinophagaceae bacterium]